MDRPEIPCMKYDAPAVQPSAETGICGQCAFLKEDHSAHAPAPQPSSTGGGAHTPTPWHVGAAVTDSHGIRILPICGPDEEIAASIEYLEHVPASKACAEANAEIIVRAVNSRAALVKALQDYGCHVHAPGPMCERAKHSEYPCTCGLNAALKAATGSEHGT